jgi:hypothetical protein
LIDGDAAVGGGEFTVVSAVELELTVDVDSVIIGSAIAELVIATRSKVVKTFFSIGASIMDEWFTIHLIEVTSCLYLYKYQNGLSTYVMFLYILHRRD